jgi:hypothetical protein
MSGKCSNIEMRCAYGRRTHSKDALEIPVVLKSRRFNVLLRGPRRYSRAPTKVLNGEEMERPRPIVIGPACRPCRGGRDETQTMRASNLSHASLSTRARAPIRSEFYESG